MKNLDFKNYDLKELSRKEKKEVGGGWVWLFNWTVIRDSDFNYSPDEYY